VPCVISYVLLPSKLGRYIQGDHIGRIFAYWAIVYFGQFVVNYKSRRNFVAAFYHRKSYLKSVTKKRFGLHFGRVLGEFWASFGRVLGEFLGEFWASFGRVFSPG
jgi:hypothetical protein